VPAGPPPAIAPDRAAWRRGDLDWVAELAARPDAVVLLTLAAAARRGRGRRPSGWTSLSVAAGAELPIVLLGTLAGASTFAAERRDYDGQLALAGLRDLRATGATCAGEAWVAVAIGNWHREHRFCPACGGATESDKGGHVRRCGGCGAEHHPRTDPVVIALVVDGDRVLLGRRASQAPNRLRTFL